MLIEDIKTLHLLPETENEIEVDVTQLVVMDEFNRPTPSNGENFRQRAVDRLVKMQVPFRSESNTVFEMTKRIFPVKCPYCQSRMLADNGGGSTQEWTTHYHCKCGAETSLSLRVDGIFVTPPKQTK